MQIEQVVAVPGPLVENASGAESTFYMCQILPALISRQVCSYDVPAYAGTEGRECCREIRQCVPRKGKPLNPASLPDSPPTSPAGSTASVYRLVAAAGFCSQPWCARVWTLGGYAGRAVFVHACIDESLWPGPWRLPLHELP